MYESLYNIIQTGVKVNNKVRKITPYNNSGKSIKRALRLGASAAVVVAGTVATKPALAASSRSEILPTSMTNAKSDSGSLSSRSSRIAVKIRKKSPIKIKNYGTKANSTSTRASREVSSAQSNASTWSNKTDLTIESTSPIQLPEIGKTLPYNSGSEKSEINSLVDQTKKRSGAIDSLFDQTENLNEAKNTTVEPDVKLGRAQSWPLLSVPKESSHRLTAENVKALQRQEESKSQSNPKKSTRKISKSVCDRKGLKSSISDEETFYTGLVSETLEKRRESAKKEFIAQNLKKKVYYVEWGLPSESQTSLRLTDSAIEPRRILNEKLTYENIVTAIISKKIPVRIRCKANSSGIIKYEALHNGEPGLVGSQDEVANYNSKIKPVLEHCGKDIGLTVLQNDASHFLPHSRVPFMFKNIQHISDRPGLTRLLPWSVNKKQSNQLIFASNTNLDFIRTVEGFCTKIMEGEYENTEDEWKQRFNLSDEQIQAKKCIDIHALPPQAAIIERQMDSKMDSKLLATQKGLIFGTMLSGYKATTSIINANKARIKISPYVHEYKISRIQEADYLGQLNWAEKEDWNNREILLQIASPKLGTGDKSLKSVGNRIIKFQRADFEKTENCKQFTRAVETTLECTIFDQALAETKPPNYHIFDGSVELSRESKNVINCLAECTEEINNSTVVQWTRSVEDSGALDVVARQKGEAPSEFAWSLEKVLSNGVKELGQYDQPRLAEIAQVIKKSMHDKTHDELQKKYEIFSKDTDNIIASFT